MIKNVVKVVCMTWLKCLLAVVLVVGTSKLASRTKPVFVFPERILSAGEAPLSIFTQPVFSVHSDYRITSSFRNNPETFALSLPPTALGGNWSEA
ncbi:MAG: hypothetical protein ACK5JD_11600, partial [Mangrovibacterium sp.]